MRKNTIETCARLLVERSKVTPSGCMEWTGARHYKGYGLLNLEGVGEKAHRVAYIVANGPIPDGMHVLHRCDNRACVNADHLFIGSNEENIADKVAKCRAGKALTKQAVERIKQMLRDGSTQQEVAGLHGVHPCSISRIASGSRWAQVN